MQFEHVEIEWSLEKICDMSCHGNHHEFVIVAMVTIIVICLPSVVHPLPSVAMATIIVKLVPNF